MKNSEKEQFMILKRIAKQKYELYHFISIQLSISDTEFCILYYFCCSDKLITQNYLSELFPIPEETIHSAIVSLIKKGYVYLEDKMAACEGKGLRLTEDGTAFCQNKIAPVLIGEKNAFSQLTEEERNNLISLSQLHHVFLLKEFNGILDNIRSDANERKMAHMSILSE